MTPPAPECDHEPECIALDEAGQGHCVPCLLREVAALKAERDKAIDIATKMLSTIANQYPAWDKYDEHPTCGTCGACSHEEPDERCHGQEEHREGCYVVKTREKLDALARKEGA